MKDNSVDSLIRNITEVVLRTHFYYVMDYDLQRDLMQEGYLKAYELLSSGNYDPYRNLRNFIYTGVRNAMSNYMYHNNQKSQVDIELIEDASWQQYKNITTDSFFNNKVYYYDEYVNLNEISIDDIKSICNKYSDFGDYTKSAINFLIELGICNGKVVETQCNENPFILEVIKGELMWNLFLKNKLKE